MGQYKGKREAESKPNHLGKPENSVGDPFAGRKSTAGERVENAFLDINWFFHSKKFKVLMGVLCSIALVAVVGVVGFKALMSRGPELPPVNSDQPNQNQQQTGQNQGQQSGDDQGQNDPPPPSDDELYPDDGYGGDMPEVSGERKKGVYTFLLVGTDKDDGNTDTIMVASYDTVNQKISIMSIPRDTMINESWDIKKINSVYSRTGNSINSLANRIKKLVGFKPDYYVKVELSVFVQLVDLVGGVEFYVPCDMDYDDPYQDLHIHLKEGLQVLDGQKAMQLVRFRGYYGGDIKRTEVQQQFLKALIQECLSLKHWGKVKAYIDLALENVQTDMDFGSIVWFAANVMGLNDASMLSMENVNTYTLPGDYWGGTWCRSFNKSINEGKQSYVTIYPNQVVKLVNESFNPYVQKITTDMLDAMSILKNGDIASSTGVLKDTKHNEFMAVLRGEAYYDEDGTLVYYTEEDEGNGDEPSIPNDGEDGEGGDSGETGNTSNGDETGSGNSGNTGNNDREDTTGGEDEGRTDTGSNTTDEDEDTTDDETGDTSGGTDEDSGETADEPVIDDEPTIPDEPTVPEDGGETGENDNEQ